MLSRYRSFLRDLPAVRVLHRPQTPSYSSTTHLVGAPEWGLSHTESGPWCDEIYDHAKDAGYSDRAIKTTGSGQGISESTRHRPPGHKQSNLQDTNIRFVKTEVNSVKSDGHTFQSAVKVGSMSPNFSCDLIPKTLQ